MSNHTPGPWNYAKSDFNDDRYSIYHNGPIAYCGENGCGPENTLANARLIAAAPDLLAATEALLVVLDTWPVSSEELEAVYRSAVAAVDRAKGRETK